MKCLGKGWDLSMLEPKRAGANIQKLRKHYGMTQSELGRKLNISHQAVSKWENGECLPDIEALLRLSQLFGTSIEQILLSENVMDHADVAPGKRTEHAALPDPIVPNPASPDVPEMESRELWTSVLEELKTKVSGPSYKTWFKNTGAQIKGDTLIVYSPNRFSTEWLYSRYSKLIADTVDRLTGKTDLKLIFEPVSAKSSGYLMGAAPERASLNLGKDKES